MTEARSKQEARFQPIINVLHQTGSVSVEALAEQFQLTVVTIRRDLDALEQTTI